MSLKKKELFSKLGINSEKSREIYLISSYPKRFKKHTIVKRDGSKRTVYSRTIATKENEEKLKTILEELYSKELEEIKNNYAYQKGKNTKINAYNHLKNYYMINIDIMKYFEHITFEMILGFLRKKMENDAAIFVAKCVTLSENNNGIRHTNLAQGSSLAPLISNLVTIRMDIKINKIIRNKRITYSRYCDDLTFSTNNVESYEFIKEAISMDGNIRKILFSQGFTINSSKTQYLPSIKSKKKVNGIIVNEKLNIEKYYISKLKLNLRFLSKPGRFEFTRDEFFLKDPKYKYRVVAEEDKSEMIEKILASRIHYIAHIKGYDDNVVKSLMSMYNEIDLFKYKFNIKDINGK